VVPPENPTSAFSSASSKVRSSGEAAAFRASLCFFAHLRRPPGRKDLRRIQAAREYHEVQKTPPATPVVTPCKCALAFLFDHDERVPRAAASGRACGLQALLRSLTGFI
jgi:hypothetical protein